MIGLFYIDNLSKTTWILVLALICFQILEKKYREYMKWIPIVCSIFSIFRILYFIDSMDYVLEAFGKDISTLVLLLNVFIGILPAIVSIVLYWKKKKD